MLWKTKIFLNNIATLNTSQYCHNIVSWGLLWFPPLPWRNVGNKLLFESKPVKILWKNRSLMELPRHDHEHNHTTGEWRTVCSCFPDVYERQTNLNWINLHGFVFLPLTYVGKQRKQGLGCISEGSPLGFKGEYYTLIIYLKTIIN